jgi:disulfide bond formation protein DsbB
MSLQAFSTFFAILALVAIVGAAGAVAIVLLGRRDPDGAAAGLAADVGRAALPLAWLIAAVATAGSLYYSKVQSFIPCELCWYQRIAIYPFSVILAIAAWRRDAGVRVYAIPVLAIGVVVAVYHAWIQAYPPSSGTSFCTADAPCTARYVWEFGFVSLPFMALAAMVSMIALLAVARPTPRAGLDSGGPE